VTLVHRRDSFRAEKIMQERCSRTPRIEVVWNSVLQEVTARRPQDRDRRETEEYQDPQGVALRGRWVFVANRPLAATQLF